MVEALDRIAVWNLVTAVDAFISSGFSPAELLQAVHPADVSSTQGTGIGGMNATAESATLEARGITPGHFSRAGDRRRAGFLEAAGGGTLLVTRGDIAADLGLPVQAVVAYARSFADGAHTSIPAPGLGALAAAHGGPILRSLTRLPIWD